MPITPTQLKALPLDIASMLVNYLNVDRVLIKQVDAKDCLIKFVENDPDPQFYFAITTVNHNSSSPSKPSLKLEVKPRHKKSPQGQSFNALVDVVPKVFDEWYKLIEAYDQTIQKLPEVDTDTQRLIDDFQIDVTDGYDEYFNINEQEQVDQLLEKTIKVLEEYHSDDEAATNKIESIAEELSKTREEQANLTKGSFRTTFLKAVAAIKSTSYPTFKKIAKVAFEETLSTIIKVGIKILIEPS